MMEEWKEYKLGEIVSPIKDRIEASVLDEHSYISTENMLPNKSGIAPSSGVPAGNVVRFQEGDVLISNIRPYFKKIWKADFVGGCSADVICFRATDRVAPLFLFYLLSQDSFFDYVMQGAKGTKMPRGDRSQILQWPISLPLLEEQRRIASILSSLDSKIEINRRINANLEQQAQALFKSWFVDFEPFKDGEFVESELGMIPKGWRVGTLGDICNQSSVKVGGRNDVKVLSPVTTGHLMLSEEYFTKQVFSENIAKYKVVNRGAFAYNPARVNIGSLGRNEYDFDGAVSPVYVVFECKKGYSNYLNLFRGTENFKNEVLLRAIGGVRQSLNYTDFAMIQSVIAPQEVVDAFNPMFEKIKESQKHFNKENERLSTLRDTLLPKLMSGELKVNA